MAEKKTHSVREVDALTAKATLDGYVEHSEVVDNTLDEMLKSLDSVMRIYMRDDLGRYQDRVKELGLMYTTLQSFAERYEENYFAKLDDLKDVASVEARDLEF